eukprot:TRINITY_DN2922_c0_g1_i2.p1 TRINITY_DN2922_c0_g1~~TRINITY_DN2922_c0_g1_i2.p1  ORF type:complete len:389 (-),score=65.29 TRINITY_DN2922_c0_g1_i2:524-1639(-)
MFRIEEEESFDLYTIFVDESPPGKIFEEEESFDLPALFEDEKLKQNVLGKIFEAEENYNLAALFRLRPNPPLDEDFALNQLFSPRNVLDMDKIQGNYDLQNMFRIEEEESFDLYTIQIQGNYGLQNLFRNEEVYLDAHGEELKNRWVFWFQSPAACWGKSMKRLYTVSSFQEVQDVLGKMTAPGRLNAQAEVYVFKQGIQPDRLDNRNQKGGCWAAFLPVAMPDGKTLLNSWFEAVVYSITTGQIPHYKDIVGVKVAIRNIDPKANNGTTSKDRLEVWTKAALNQDKQLEIGHYLKNLLIYNGNLRLTYMKHQDVVQKTIKTNHRRAKNVGHRHSTSASGRFNNRRQQKSPKKDLPSFGLKSIKSLALYRL